MKKYTVEEIMAMPKIERVHDVLDGHNNTVRKVAGLFSYIGPFGSGKIERLGIFLDNVTPHCVNSTGVELDIESGKEMPYLSPRSFGGTYRPGEGISFHAIDRVEISILLFDTTDEMMNYIKDRDYNDVEETNV